MSWPEAKKINSDPRTPLNEGGVKIVKSVQWGNFNTTKSNNNNDTSTQYLSVAISEVDLEKSIVILDGGSAYSNCYKPALLSEFNSDNLVFSRNFMSSELKNYFVGRWTVVEYY